MGAPGCDDAEVVEVFLLDGKERDVTLVVPYYENPRFFARQLCTWAKYPDGLARRLHVIVCDDGSPMNPARNVVETFRDETRGLASFSLYRIRDDVRWNWLAARNIGVHHAGTEWVMLTDMDHVLEPDVLETLVRGDHDARVIYRFSRREHTGAKVHPHPNSWFMTREMFWRVGGYDEALSGHYGTDGEYRRRCAATAPVKIMSDELVRFEYVGDSSTTRYKRKQPEDARAKQMIKQRGPGWKPRTLSFAYDQVQL